MTPDIFGAIAFGAIGGVLVWLAVFAQHPIESAFKWCPLFVVAGSHFGVFSLYWYPFMAKLLGRILQ